ncbi:hypothetical protein BMETH_860_1 [methanotrophic bacterial endosymbiont of Bathymodiolus sp.]|nr:hypothetical protein BMETH_860_1 [methanotrophic bacterial endosymbiont of Bathymodiolus sp.]
MSYRDSQQTILCDSISITIRQGRMIDMVHGNGHFIAID